MPDEVFDRWIAPFIAQIGWPFVTTEDDLGNTRWKYLLARMPLSVWAAGQWRLIVLDAKEALADPLQEVMFRETIKGGVYGDKTLGANLQDTEERFRACADFIRINDTIPTPIVGTYCNGIFKILDGNHRLAALFHVKGFRSHKVPCWLFQKEHLAGS
jgi:hypothetical protein